MGTNVNPAQAPVPAGDPNFTKLADQATQALGGMLKLTHKQSPDSPLVDVFTQIIKAIGDIENEYESGGLQGMMSGDPAAAGPDPLAGGDPMAGGDPLAGGSPPPIDDPALGGMGEEPPPPGAEFPGPGGGFATASADMQGMMQAAAKKKNR